jgi:hypothetical protein
MLPVFGQFLVGADWSRFAMYAFVVIVPVGAIAAWTHPRRHILLGLISLQLVPTAVDLLADGRLRLNVMQPSLWVTAGLMAVTLIVLVQPFIGSLLHRSADSLKAADGAAP